jgi:hypothetical protein
MFRIALSVGVPWRAYAKVPKDLGRRLGKNHELLVKHEMLPFSNDMPDVETIKKNGIKVFMAAGKRTLETGKYYGRTAPVLADLLGCEMVTFPGHHLSYLDMPQAWAAALRAVLQKRGEHRASPALRESSHIRIHMTKSSPLSRVRGTWELERGSTRQS